MITQTICLTEPPELVALKREFRKLDEEELRLKPTSRGGHITATNAMLLETVRNRKAEIARECYQLGLRNGQGLLTSAATAK